MFFPGALGTLIEIEQLEGYKKSYIVSVLPKFSYWNIPKLEINYKSYLPGNTIILY